MSVGFFRKRPLERLLQGDCDSLLSATSDRSQLTSFVDPGHAPESDVMCYWWIEMPLSDPARWATFSSSDLAASRTGTKSSETSMPQPFMF